jgi:hypothetical protein
VLLLGFIQIDELDTMQLILTAKGQEFANNFNALFASAAAWGYRDSYPNSE